MQTLIAILIVIVLLIVYTSYNDYVSVPLQYRTWQVIGSYQNNKEAARLLDSVHNSMLDFMRFLKKKYHIGETDDVISAEGSLHESITRGDAYQIIYTLLCNYNPDEFYEADPAKTSDTSWTVNKGDAMYICMRKRSDPTQLIDKNLVLFVVLHECAHIANYNGWGHPTRFWEVFKFLLHEAEESGIMRNVDYSKFPQWYCGLYMNYNPYFDNTLRNIWLM